jgi:hypothetical protein
VCIFQFVAGRVDTGFLIGRVGCWDIGAYIFGVVVHAGIAMLFVCL